MVSVIDVKNVQIKINFFYIYGVRVVGVLTDASSWLAADARRGVRGVLLTS